VPASVSRIVADWLARNLQGREAPIAAIVGGLRAARALRRIETIQNSMGPEEKWPRAKRNSNPPR
jgi:hypothetical protein